MTPRYDLYFISMLSGQSAAQNDEENLPPNSWEAGLMATKYSLGSCHIAVKT
jgi:hypothetical protein